jgi:hypothetical protein
MNHEQLEHDYRSSMQRAALPTYNDTRRNTWWTLTCSTRTVSGT